VPRTFHGRPGSRELRSSSQSGQAQDRRGHGWCLARHRLQRWWCSNAPGTRAVTPSLASC